MGHVHKEAAFGTHFIAMGAKQPSKRLLEWCSRGIRSADLCCSTSCKVCGGSSPSVPTLCTRSYLQMLGRTCTSAIDVACLVPDNLPPRRGNHTPSCATAVSERLPLLMRAFVATVGVNRSMLSEMYWQASTAWQDCVESFGGVFWELRLGKADWPELYATFGRSLFTQDLQIFMCAPSIFQHDQWLPPVTACARVENLIKEVLPLSLRLKFPEIFLRGDADASDADGQRLQLPPPRGTSLEVKGGEGPNGQALLWDLRARAVSSQSSQLRQHAHPPRAAVCIAGLARSLWMPEVHESIAEIIRTLGARTQIFYVLDLQGRKLRDFSAALRAVPPDQLAFYNERRGTSGTWSKLARCHWTPGDNSHHVFEKFHTCLHMITEAEKAQSFRFDWVLRLRPDMAWMAPIGDLGNLDPNSVHILRRKTFPYPSDTADTFAIVPRKHLHSYFGTGCPTERDVRWAYLGRLCYGLFCNATGCSTISECVLQTRLASRSVPVVAFPPLMRVVRESVCHAGDMKCLSGWKDTFLVAQIGEKSRKCITRLSLSDF